MIVISRHVAIPDGELEITAIRAQGAAYKMAILFGCGTHAGKFLPERSLARELNLA